MKEKIEELVKCAKCGGFWPHSELTGGVCPDCHLIADGILPPISERWKIWQIGDEQC